jgi:hypothetical protein
MAQRAVGRGEVLAMRLQVMILVLLAAVGLSAALYWLSGGRWLVFALPLVVVVPLLGRGRRR